MDLPVLLLLGVPGAFVWLWGQSLIFRALGDGGKRSARGLPLTMAGLGLIILGWLIGLEIDAVESVGWILAVAILPAFAFPLVMFWMATRAQVTDGDCRS